MQLHTVHHMPKSGPVVDSCFAPILIRMILLIIFDQRRFLWKEMSKKLVQLETIGEIGSGPECQAESCWYPPYAPGGATKALIV